MEKQKFKISILMANYNKAEYIEKAINSVLNQTSSDWELVLLDDCSVDSSLDVISKYKNNKKINIISLKKNLGKINALRVMIKESKNRIIGILDSDDYLEPDAVRLVLNKYNSCSECELVYSNFMFCDKNLKPVKSGFGSAMNKGDSNIFKPYILHFLTFKKDCFLKTSGFDDDILYSEDYDIILKLEEVCKTCFIDSFLYKYRRVPDSQTTDPIKREISRINSTIAKYKAFKRRRGTELPNLSPRKMSSELMLSILPLIKIKKIDEAKKYLILALKISPFNMLGLLLVFFRIVKFPFYKIYRKFIPNYIESPIKK